MRSEYFCRIRSASAFLFSKLCSSLNEALMIAGEVGVADKVVGKLLPDIVRAIEGLS